MTFEEIYQIVEESSNEAAFNREECEAMYNIAIKAPKNSVFVEIGVQFGRSLSVLSIAAQETNSMVDGVDNWGEDVSSEARTHIKAKIEKYGWETNLIEMKSHQAVREFKGANPLIYLLHVDGDHTYNGVTLDCIDWCPLVEVGGYVCFDDYGHDSLPDVYSAVTDYMADHPEWKFVGRYGNKLGIFKKL